MRQFLRIRIEKWRTGMATLENDRNVFWPLSTVRRKQLKPETPRPAVPF